MRSNQTFFTKSADETRALGEQWGRDLRPGDLITLSGTLGAGKTTLVQGMARALNLASPIVSPTFVLIIEHQGDIPLLHLDAYRLENLSYESLCDAGVMDLLQREDAIKVIEWPERIQQWLPEPRLAVRFAPNSSSDAADDGRRLDITFS